MVGSVGGTLSAVESSISQFVSHTFFLLRSRQALMINKTIRILRRTLLTRRV